jgi:hypothetical protein
MDDNLTYFQRLQKISARDNKPILFRDVCPIINDLIHLVNGDGKERQIDIPTDMTKLSGFTTKLFEYLFRRMRPFKVDYTKLGVTLTLYQQEYKTAKIKRGADRVGEKYGNLVVVEDSGEKNKRNKILWLCRCDCGNEILLGSEQLSRGKTSCGCVAKRPTIYKMKFYPTWSAMINRCYNRSNKNYFNYGGRGIGVCDEWRDDYFPFHRWAATMWKSGLSLDRIDNNGWYSPENCRYTRSIIQMNNRAITVKFEINGITKPLRTWVDEYGANRDLVYKRIKAGWNPIKALTTKSQRI